MSSNLAKLEERIAKMEEAAAELRELTSEAHSTLKQLRKERREAEDLITRMVPEQVRQLIVTEVAEQLGRFADDVESKRDMAVASITEEFDALADIFIRGNGSNEEHLLAQAHEARELRRARMALIREGGA